MKVSAQRMIRNKLIRWGEEILTISEEKACVHTSRTKASGIGTIVGQRNYIHYCLEQHGKGKFIFTAE